MYETVEATCRLACDPWIVTLPNTAIAPVAAIAIERVRVFGERSSITAIRSTPQPNGLQAIEDREDRVEQERQ